LLGLAQFDKRDSIVKFAFETGDRAEAVVDLGSLAHDFLRGLGVVPQVGIFDLGVEFGETACGGLDVKDASSAIPWIA
jgi:hypothetical protein